MKTNGFSNERYEHVLTNAFVVMSLAWVIPLVISTIVMKVIPDDNARIFDVSFSLAIVVFVATLIVLLAILIFGRPIYKQYAAQVIDFNEGTADIERIKITPEAFTIDYDEDGEVKTAEIKYSDYGIKVMAKKGFDHPIFYYCGSRIFEVVIPYSKEENPSWEEYEVE